MIVEAAIDHPLGNRRQNNHRRYTDSIAVEGKSMTVNARHLLLISRRRRSRWGHMIVQPAVLAPGNNKHPARPNRRISDPDLNFCNELIAASYLVDSVLLLPPRIFHREP